MGSCGSPVATLPLQIKYDPTVLEFVQAKPAAPSNEGGVGFKTHGIPASGLLFITQGNPLLPVGEAQSVMRVEFKAQRPAERTVVTLLPTTPSEKSGRTVKATAPALIGIEINP